jgi:NAD(P)-dependent dehydrogenase (short-subunit alcohol dehydrogenase family)
MAMDRLTAEIVVRIRRLLAVETGDPDLPLALPLLSTFTDEDAVAYAGGEPGAQAPALAAAASAPPLFLEGETPELDRAFRAYQEAHGRKPEVVCLSGRGVVCVASPASSKGGPLRNKVAVVTGAAGAIGHGVVRGLLDAGCAVAATDLAGPQLEQMLSHFEDGVRDHLITVALDVTDRASVARGLDAVAARWGGIDIAVVNAGIAHVAALNELDLETFRKLERVNVEGTLLTISEASKLMIAQGAGGDMVLISTKNVFAPGARFGAYSATKAASHQLGRIASLELAEHGIRVNMVSPDAVFSDRDVRSGLWATVGPDRMRARGLDEKGLEEYYRSRNLLKARVTAKHVANAVLFFVTHQTPTTGATIPVDGGLPDAAPR